MKVSILFLTLCFVLVGCTGETGTGAARDNATKADRGSRADATGKVLDIKVRITRGTGAATKVVTFHLGDWLTHLATEQTLNSSLRDYTTRRLVLQEKQLIAQGKWHSKRFQILTETFARLGLAFLRVNKRLDRLEKVCGAVHTKGK